MVKRYIGLKLPKELTDLIDKIVEEGYMGYRNRGEFAVDAIRRRLEEIDKLRSAKYEKRKG